MLRIPSFKPSLLWIAQCLFLFSKHISEILSLLRHTIRTWKIRPGDLVYVNSGNDRGSSGEVLMIDPRRNMLKVKGMNKRKAPWRCYAGRQAMNDWIMMDHVYGLYVLVLYIISCNWELTCFKYVEVLSVEWILGTVLHLDLLHMAWQNDPSSSKISIHFSGHRRGGERKIHREEDALPLFATVSLAVSVVHSRNFTCCGVGRCNREIDTWLATISRRFQRGFTRTLAT